MLTLGRRIWCDSKMPNGLKNNEDGILLANDVALAPASPVANHQIGGRKVTVIFYDEEPIAKTLLATVQTLSTKFTHTSFDTVHSERGTRCSTATRQDERQYEQYE